MAENRSHGGAGDTTGATRPQAYHAGISTFMRRPMTDLARLRPGATAVFGDKVEARRDHPPRQPGGWWGGSAGDP